MKHTARTNDSIRCFGNKYIPKMSMGPYFERPKKKLKKEMIFGTSQKWDQMQAQSFQKKIRY